MRGLGGPPAYAAGVMEGMGVAARVVAKVADDFLYGESLAGAHSPIQVAESKTTEFFADFTAGGERRLTAGHVCSPIWPSDLPAEGRYDVALATGAGDEILPATLDRMSQLADRVILDLQGVVRVIDRHSGAVTLRQLAGTPFEELLPRVAAVKASRLEAAFFDPAACAQRCPLVVVTEGPFGCTLYARGEKDHVPAFPVEEVDPTGAGDAFLGGLAAGLCRGLPPAKAAAMGNFFGALTAAHVGVPPLTPVVFSAWHAIESAW